MRHINRLGASVLGVLATAITFSAATAWAGDLTDDELGPTPCGAGVLAQCGNKPITKCEYDISINLNLFSRDFGFHFKTTNCTVIGSIPIYKDRDFGPLPLESSSATRCSTSDPIWTCD
jgi:hypothetical protein